MRFSNWFRTTVAASLLCASSLIAQPAPSEIWHPVETAQRRPALEDRIERGKSRLNRLNAAALRQVLQRAPREKVPGQKIDDGEEISLPMPDGTFARFRFVESPIMEPELAARFPDIKTYAGVGVDDPTATVRFDLTEHGFHAQILSAEGAIYIDPERIGDAETHVSYRKRDYKRVADDFKCLLPPQEGLLERRAGDEVVANRSGNVLRTFRLACAATGEYTAFHGGTVNAGMAAITTAINRINQIYEKEIGVRLVLVANNHLVVFTNAATDPYDNDDGSAMLGQNQSRLDSVIGSANYDIGHVFSTGGGGIASLGSVCVNGYKARGVTGSSSPVNDAFYVDYVAHEMGHQFGANHTFNSQGGSCGGGNRNSSTAYEPGSGSTIMAYAGICSSDNLQFNSDPYFHSASFDEIISFLSIASCAQTTSTGNTVPTVSAGPNYTIPKGTPFTLTATGSDADGDTLTYCWEERDLGPAQSLNASDNGSSPLFRSFNPTTSPSRTFPRLSTILANTTSTSEKLPALGRVMKFRVTVRDNRSGGGGVNTSDMQVVVDGNSGPFRVTSPNTAVSWSGARTVTWDVAGTSGSPVNCASVNILLSTDGGNTFPIVLATNTPNDGSQTVVLPSINTSAARIKVEAVNNIFFDISDVNFSLSTYVDGVANVGVDALALVGEACSPTNNVIDPGELVTLRLALKNYGLADATNVTAFLLQDAGVVSPNPQQDFGTLTVGGDAVYRDYHLVAGGSCGGTLPVRFEIWTNGVFSSRYTNIFTLGGTTSNTTSRTNSSYINIQDGSTSPYPSSISVSGVSGTVEKVTVSLIGLTHTYAADVDALLVGPQGQKAVLMADAGGGYIINLVNLTFDDDAPSQLPEPFGSGTYQPTVYSSHTFPSPAPAGPYGSSLSVFKNTNPNGTWSLYLYDRWSGDTGYLNGGWRIHITTQTPQCCEGSNPPVISSIADRTISENGTTGSIPFTVWDYETSPGSLVVTGTSSNTGLIPNANVVLGGSGGNRTVTVTPVPGQTGSSVITISVYDGQFITQETFLVTVVPPLKQSVVLAGNQLTLSWPSVNGKNYQIQFKNDLSEPVWQVITTVTANGSTASHVETIGGDQKFFRIVAVE